MNIATATFALPKWTLLDTMGFRPIPAFFGPHELSPEEAAAAENYCILRERLEAFIEQSLDRDETDQYIQLLDDLDGDWDLENSMGMKHDGSRWIDEAEVEADLEPSLGSPDAVLDQSDWGGPIVVYQMDDCELDRCDLEPEFCNAETCDGELESKSSGKR